MSQMIQNKLTKEDRYYMEEKDMIDEQWKIIQKLEATIKKQAKEIALTKQEREEQKAKNERIQGLMHQVDTSAQMIDELQQENNQLKTDNKRITKQLKIAKKKLNY